VGRNADSRLDGGKPTAGSGEFLNGPGEGTVAINVTVARQDQDAAMRALIQELADYMARRGMRLQLTEA
jgi:hypothetical protein